MTNFYGFNLSYAFESVSEGPWAPALPSEDFLEKAYWHAAFKRLIFFLMTSSPIATSRTGCRAGIIIFFLDLRITSRL